VGLLDGRELRDGVPVGMSDTVGSSVGYADGNGVGQSPQNPPPLARRLCISPEGTQAFLPFKQN